MVLQGLHGNSTEGSLLQNLYCLECSELVGHQLVQRRALMGQSDGHRIQLYQDAAGRIRILSHQCGSI